MPTELRKKVKVQNGVLLLYIPGGRLLVQLLRQRVMGLAACAAWDRWGREKGLLSDTPKLGAAILYYGDPSRPNHANHIGIVAGIYPDAPPDKRIKTIEGNTTGGAGFNRSGCGCFVKYPNPNRKVKLCASTR